MQIYIDESGTFALAEQGSTIGAVGALVVTDGQLPATRMPHALDIRRYTRADLAGSLDGFRLRWLHRAGPLGTGSANGKIALRSSFHVHIFPIHRLHDSWL